MELCPSSKEEDESVGEADEWDSIDRENVDILKDLLMENQWQVIRGDTCSTYKRVLEPHRKTNMQQQRQDSNTRWTFLGTAIPKSEIVYFCQMFLVYLIVVTSIVNLSMNSGKTELWVSLLSSAIGYALPSPSLNKQQHEWRHTSSITLLEHVHKWSNRKRQNEICL